MESSKNQNLPLVIAAFISIYLIWGSTYMFNKILVAELPPFLLAGIRFVTAAVIIFGIAAVRGKLGSVSKKQLINSAFAGFLFLTVGNGCAVWALQFIDSSLEALLISAQPLILIIMLYFLEKKPIYLKSMIGVALGILGIYLLVSQGDVNAGPGKWWGIGAVFVALICWGYGSIFVSKADFPKNSFIKSGYQMLFGGGMMLILSFVLNEPTEGIFTMSDKAIYSMIYLITFGSIVAFTSFNYLLLTVSPEKVATSTYINPIVAMLLGWWILDEVITNQAIVAALVLLTGVYFINTSRSRAIKVKSSA